MRTFALVLCWLPIAQQSMASTVSWTFGRGANGVNGLASAVATSNGVALSLTAEPQGAALAEVSAGGLGVNSRGIAGVVDDSNDKFDVLGGTLAGQSEGLTFSFDTDGVLNELRFDGLKDESFEHFRFETPTGQVFTLFDSQIGLRLIDVGSIGLPGVTLLAESGGLDDDLVGLSIPFRAGDVFRLTYGEYLPDPSELVVSFNPQTGNGGRFQGVTITAIPEPATLLVFAAGLAAAAPRRRQFRP
ncbi:MAG: hypothetical protein AAF916_11775 [Planctomycetota bacterium]